MCIFTRDMARKHIHAFPTPGQARFRRQSVVVAVTRPRQHVREYVG